MPPPFSIRSRVEGQPIPGDPRYFPGTVVEVHSETLVSVQYIGVPNSSGVASVVEVAHLRPCELPPNAFAFVDIKPGLKCSAKFTGDGKFYPARIDDVTSESTIRVTYAGYGNTEIVPIEYIASPSSTASGLAKAAPTGASAPASGGDADDDDKDDEEEKGIYAGLHIPENLRTLPTDGPEERLRKRKKIKALKHVWRQRYTEALGEKKKSTWQSFITDKSRKAPAGFISSAVAKESIFRSSAPASAAPSVATGKSVRTWTEPTATVPHESEADWPLQQPSPFKRAR
jgi:hypothetical protein